MVAHRGDALGMHDLLGGVGLVLVKIDCAGECGDAVVHGDLHVAELLLVESGLPRLRLRGSGLALRACGRR